MTNAIQVSNRTQVGDTIIYQCKLGYTRLRENADSISCEADDGIPKWKGGDQLEWCQRNYCNLSDLRIENAKLLNTIRGEIPEDFEWTANQSLQFSDQALLIYTCIPNYHFNNSETLSTQCIFPPNQIGFGVWETPTLNCTRMLLCLFHTLLANIYLMSCI